MIIGKLHPGSGLGDQLFSYIITRVIALDKGYEFGFVGKEFFKGKDFMNLDWGKESGFKYVIEKNTGGLVLYDEVILSKKVFVFDKPYYDPEVNFIQDGTIIDGTAAQSEQYWGHRLDEIRKWLKVEPLEVENVVLNLRGGEYKTIPDLYLPKEYWELGIYKMLNYKVKGFEVHTDDKQAVLDYNLDNDYDNWTIISDISFNWRSIRYAKNAIISNSAFAIIPRLLKHLEDPQAITMAPKYWAGRNVGEWRRPQNYYSKFTYI